MPTVVKILAVVVAFTALASAAAAETRAVEIADVQPGVFNIIDLGAQFAGITEVTIRATGIGGRGFYECSTPEFDGWYDVDFRVCLGNGCIEFPTSSQVAYDVTATAILDGGSWQVCEGVTVCSLTASVLPHGLANSLNCNATVIEVPPISRLVVTITADSVVGTDSRSWGGVKALYRDGAAR